MRVILAKFIHTGEFRPVRVILACREKERSRCGVLVDIEGQVDIHEVNGLPDERGRRSIASNQDGQTMVEYGVILAVVALLATAAFLTFGQAVVAMFGPIVNAVTS